MRRRPTYWERRPCMTPDMTRGRWRSSSRSWRRRQKGRIRRSSCRTTRIRGIASSAWMKRSTGWGACRQTRRGISQSGGLAYGMIMSVRQAQADASEHALENATQSLIQELAKTNPGLKVTRQPGRVQLNGQPGLSTYLSNDSPAGGQETDWLVTVLQPQGLLSFLCVAPRAAYPEYESTFAAVLDSVRLTK